MAAGLGFDSTWKIEQAYFVDLSADGRSLVLGNRMKGGDSGVVMVFDAPNWHLRGTPLPIEGWWSGHPVSLSGNGQYLAIGDEKNYSVQVYKYNKTASDWKPHGAAPSTPISRGSMFGYATAMSYDGRTLAVGAPIADTASSQLSGLVRVYTSTQDLGPSNGTELPPSQRAAHNAPITISIQLDRFPEQTGLSLVCDGETFVNAPAFSFRSDFAAEQKLQDVFMVPSDASCELTLTDSGGKYFVNESLSDTKRTGGDGFDS